MKGRVAALFVVFAAAILVSTDVLCKTTEINLGDMSPSQKKEQLIWNVNRSITGFRVEIKAGKPIINEVRFLGLSQKWLVGAYFDAGQIWEQKLSSATNVGQLRVNVDKAQGSKLRLVVYTSGGGTAKTTTTTTTAKSGEVVIGTYTASEKKQNPVFNVNRSITGFRVEIKTGQLIINEVRFLGGKKFTVGRYFNAGEKYEQKLGSATNVGQLRVNLDKAKGDQIRLVVYTGTIVTTSDDDDDDDIGVGKIIKGKDPKEKLDDLFKGF